MFEVAYVAYNFNDGSWTDEVFFSGTRAACQNWLDNHCSTYYEADHDGKCKKLYWLGSKRLEIYKA